MANQETDFYGRLTQEMGEKPIINLVLRTGSRGLRISFGTIKARPIVAEADKLMTVEEIAGELPRFMRENFPSACGKIVRVFGSAEDARDKKPPLVEIKLSK